MAIMPVALKRRFKLKPMLAGTVSDLKALNYPLYGSPKLDGIRVLLHPELGPVTRNFKPVANRHAREQLLKYCPFSFDGEIIVGDPTNAKCFNETSSAIMSHGGSPKFSFYVFDTFHCENDGFQKRLQRYKDTVNNIECNSPILSLFIV